MELKVVLDAGGHRLGGDGPITDVANAYLAHLESRGFAATTLRAYAFDLLNFNRFLAERRLSIGEVVPGDVFDWLDWQAVLKSKPERKVVRLVEACRDLLEVIEDRSERRSTVVASQLPVDKWLSAMADPTLGEAILDRLCAASHRIAMKGPSQRCRQPGPAEEDES